ncbi:hypothetical protein [Terasakiella sp. SH-1]|uniref:hypothetical protein n=1 Tax=Terasakiella sp. SH-1 TaxID=2560057 RepID=UPI0010737CF5|nr:hypothetical protein [Terasakiella sp. SH-1]
MSDTTQTNAMAEIALALAMGFFSIMVLTMVSMGSGMVTQGTASTIKEEPISLAKTAEKTPPSEEQGAGAQVKHEDLVIFYNGMFLDHRLKPISSVQISRREKIILAVSPDLPMSETMQVRSQISSNDMTVVMLNDMWLNALKEAGL